MSSENLLAIGRLEKLEASRDPLVKLLSAAGRSIADAKIKAVSAEIRFDAAYKAIMQCATVALWMKGYRTSTSEPGHHQTTLQALPMTLGLDSETMIVLDGLRKQRNLFDYRGDRVSDASLAECIRRAEDLRARVRRLVDAKWPPAA